VGQNQPAFEVSASPEEQIWGDSMHATPPLAVVQPYSTSLSQDAWSV
jgi:hypothetical protein